MNNCVFCKIIANQIPAKSIFESEKIICIQDINPKASIHYLIIPRHHYTNISSVIPSEQSILIDMFLAAQGLGKIDSMHSEYRLVINNGAKAGQTIFHLHMHFLSGALLPDF